MNTIIEPLNGYILLKAHEVEQKSKSEIARNNSKKQVKYTVVVGATSSQNEELVEGDSVIFDKEKAITSGTYILVKPEHIVAVIKESK